jgi:hypothetical protein
MDGGSASLDAAREHDACNRACENRVRPLDTALPGKFCSRRQIAWRPIVL